MAEDKGQGQETAGAARDDGVGVMEREDTRPDRRTRTLQRPSPVGRLAI